MLKATEKLPKNPTLSKSEWLTFPVCLVVLLGLFSWLGWPGFSAGFCSLLFYLVWNQVNDCFDAFARTWEGNLVFMDHLAWSRPLIWEAKQQKTHLNRKWHLEKEVLQLDTVSYKRFPGFFWRRLFPHLLLSAECFLAKLTFVMDFHSYIYRSNASSSAKLKPYPRAKATNKPLNLRFQQLSNFVYVKCFQSKIHSWA